MTACPPKFASLPKPTQNQYFVLAKDHVRIEKRGLGYTWAEGLRAGIYTLAAEDDSGLYFLGEGKSVVYMSNEPADRYVKTGEIQGGQKGGLWLPKRGVDEAPRIWFEAAAPTQDGPGAMWAAIGAGEVRFIGYGSEKDFVSKIQIITK
ncbi:hypothetical protein [Anaeromyxobacter oryzisoli]|uniref:hypothetical protein n=1 Tax=Anaeromyxobacter oryzisoli TaxID=2925408 RepID=UPI001F5803EA|nr:hypothetical protein [Anaeromyxobacter sp. SG63]